MDKLSAEIKKWCDSKPAYNENFLKIKIKSYGDEVTDFCDKEIPKVDSNYTCSMLNNLDSDLKKQMKTIIFKYYPQCVYTLRKK